MFDLAVVSEQACPLPECLYFSNTTDHVVVLVYTVNNVIKLTFVANVGIFVTHNGAQNAHGISDRLH